MYLKIVPPMYRTVLFCYNTYMSRHHYKRRGALLFVEVLALVLVVGLGLLFFYAESKGKVHIQDKEDNSSKVAIEIFDIEEIKGSNVNEEAVDHNADVPTSRYGELLADVDYCRDNHVYSKETMSPDEVNLLFAGDVGLAEGYAIYESLKQRGGEITAAFNQETLDVMRNADIFMVNNEFTYTTRGVPTQDKQYTFRTNPDNVRYLFDMGVDIVSLANNHVYDYGEQSLIDTIDTLEKVEMPYVGAGMNIDEAVKPTYFIANDMRIAIVSATQIERQDNPDTRGATQDSPGTFRCWYNDRVLEVISEARDCSDYVIAYIHWGTELQEQTDWAQDELAPKLAEAGADLIIGDHPHILQRLDYIGNVPVIYSLGNYWFNSKLLDTGMLGVTLNTDGTVKRVRFLPAVQSDCRTNIANAGDWERIIGYMQSISPRVSIDSEGIITKRE